MSSYRRLTADVRSVWSRLREAPQPVRLAALGAVVALVSVAVWWGLRPEQRSAEETVDEFFAAQREGDCDRLIGLVTESSWSNDGRWSRDEFLDHCADAIEDFEPHSGELSISIYDEEGNYLSPYGDDDPDGTGDRAVVAALGGDELWSIYREGSASPAGSLVREDGEWRVEVDDVVLRIGRSVHDTVIGYLDAYNDGDCGRLISYLSESAWSANGQLDRSEFLDRCAAAADARDDLDQPAVTVPQPASGIVVRLDDGERSQRDIENVDVVFRGNDQATAAVQYGADGVPLTGVFALGDGDGENTLLVREGLQWKLDGSEELPAGGTPDLQVAAVGYAELQARLIDEIRPEGEVAPCASYDDEPRGQPADETQFQLAIRRTWYRCTDDQIRVTLRQFADEDLAQQAVEEMVGDEPVTLASQVPDVPGIPDDAFAAGGGGVVAQGRLVVSVDFFIVGSRNDAAQILVSQIDNL